MERREDILNELKEITKEAGYFSPGNPYQAPAGYFEYFPEEMLTRIKAAESVFNSVSDELQTISPLLAKMDKRMPFSVPEDYFSKLEEVMSSTSPQAAQLPESKVVQLSFARKSLRFGIAAAVIGLIATGAWFLTQSNGVEKGYASAQDVIQNVQKLSDNEINAYFEGNSGNAEAVYQSAAVSDEIKTEDVKLMLADVSDEELLLYTEQDNAETPVLN